MGISTQKNGRKENWLKEVDQLQNDTGLMNEELRKIIGYRRMEETN